MLNDCAVLNASPLITLFKSQQASLLPKLFREIVVPEAVWAETHAGDQTDPAAQQLADPISASWCRREQVVVPTLIQAWDLGAGESEVLAYALAHPTHLAIVDDAAARRCAHSLKIKVTGTVGLFILAKRRAIMPEVMPGIQALRMVGLWLDDQLIEQVRQQVGE
jgi:predicted nucleic acid-binding protein